MKKLLYIAAAFLLSVGAGASDLADIVATNGKPVVAVIVGNYSGVTATSDGVLSEQTVLLVRPANNYEVAISRGLITGRKIVQKFGQNPDIDNAATYETIWGGGGAYTGFDATAAETITIVSSDTNDKYWGTGARTIEIFGLDGNYEEQSETISLSGTTAVDSVGTYIRCDRAIINTAGSGATNAGAVTGGQKTTTANIFFSILAGFGQTTIAAYTIPAGKTGFLHDWEVALSGKTVSNISARLRHKPFGGVALIKDIKSVKAAGTSVFRRPYKYPKGPFLEKSDVYITGSSDTNNIAVSGGFELLVVDD